MLRHRHRLNMLFRTLSTVFPKTTEEKKQKHISRTSGLTAVFLVALTSKSPHSIPNKEKELTIKPSVVSSVNLLIFMILVGIFD